MSRRALQGQRHPWRRQWRLHLWSLRQPAWLPLCPLPPGGRPCTTQARPKRLAVSREGTARALSPARRHCRRARGPVQGCGHPWARPRTCQHSRMLAQKPYRVAWRSSQCQLAQHQDFRRLMPRDARPYPPPRLRTARVVLMVKWMSWMRSPMQTELCAPSPSPSANTRLLRALRRAVPTTSDLYLSLLLLPCWLGGRRPAPCGSCGCSRARLRLAVNTRGRAPSRVQVCPMMLAWRERLVVL